MRVLVIVVVGSLFSFACGPGGGAGGTGGGSGGTTGGGAGSSGGGSGSAMARISFIANVDAAPPADRLSFSATIDDAGVSPNFDARALTSMTGVFHPGLSTGSALFAPGAHTLSMSGSVNTYSCLNPPNCDQIETQVRGDEVTTQFTAEAGKSYVAVFTLTSYSPGPNAPTQVVGGIVVHTSPAVRDPDGNIFGVFYVRPAEVPGARTVSVGVTAHDTCSGEVNVTSVAPAASAFVARDPLSDADLVVRSDTSTVSRWELPAVPVDPVRFLPYSAEPVPVLGTFIPTSGSGAGIELAASSCP